MEVNKEARGPLVTLSRAHAGLVRRMFELEIPEIQDGIVMVKAVAREAGSRTKIAVWSRDEDVDAVGACIGNHGMRISAIVDELGGEKIDIIKYSEVPEEYVGTVIEKLGSRKGELLDMTPRGDRTKLTFHISLNTPEKGVGFFLNVVASSTLLLYTFISLL